MISRCSISSADNHIGYSIKYRMSGMTYDVMSLYYMQLKASAIKQFNKHTTYETDDASTLRKK